jgi:hypothetical protein
MLLYSTKQRLRVNKRKSDIINLHHSPHGESKDEKCLLVLMSLLGLKFPMNSLQQGIQYYFISGVVGMMKNGQ